MIPPTSLVVGKQGFDCVVKGFRIGRQARRPHWAEDRVIMWEPNLKLVILIWGPTNLEDGNWLTYHATGEDIMATDWEVWG